MIPKIIHQMWVQGFENMPNQYQLWSNLWQEKNPNWEYKFWYEENTITFLKENYPQYIDVYTNLITVKKTDFFRLILLHHFGGVWVDTDTYPLQPLDDLIKKFDLEKYDMIVGFENDDNGTWKSKLVDNARKKIEEKFDKYYPKSKTLIVGSAFLMFRPNQQFLIDFIEFSKNKVDEPVLNHFSTWIWTDYLLDFVDKLNVKILPSYICLTPIETDETYIVHKYDGTWLKRNQDIPWHVV